MNANVSLKKFVCMKRLFLFLCKMLIKNLALYLCSLYNHTRLWKGEVSIDFFFFHENHIKSYILIKILVEQMGRMSNSSTEIPVKYVVWFFFLVNVISVHFFNRIMLLEMYLQLVHWHRYSYNRMQTWK